MAQDPAFLRRIQRIGEIVEQIDAGTDPHARAIAKELIESLMALHGGALERILEITAETGEPGETIIRKCGHDELVSSVLLLYGLHPEGLHTRVERALDKAHKLLESHGATAKLGSVSDDGKVTVRIELKAGGCGSSSSSVMSTLESLIQDAAPDASDIVIEEVRASLTRSGFVSLAKLESGKSMVELYSASAERGRTDMAVSSPPGSAFGALRQFARKRSAIERCEMCSQELGTEHDHLVEPEERKLICACQACAILFQAQGASHYKRVPREVMFLRDFQLSDAQWDGLMVPIDMAFFFHSTPQGKVIALYPSPAGPTESLLSLDSWSDIVQMNPVLIGMQPDVTALLVNRVGHVRGVSSAEYYLVPIDECYKLVGLIRTHWRGLSGGTEVWREFGAFFAALKKRAGISAEAGRA